MLLPTFGMLDELIAARAFWRYTGMRIRPLSDQTAVREMQKTGYTEEAALLHAEGGRERAIVIGYAGPVAWLVNKKRVVFWIPRFASGVSDWSYDRILELYRHFVSIHGRS